MAKWGCRGLLLLLLLPPLLPLLLLLLPLLLLLLLLLPLLLLLLPPLLLAAACVRPAGAAQQSLCVSPCVVTYLWWVTLNGYIDANLPDLHLLQVHQAGAVRFRLVVRHPADKGRVGRPAVFWRPSTILMA